MDVPRATERWLYVAPVAALVATAATWIHYFVTGSVRLRERSGDPALGWTSVLAAAALVLLGVACVRVFREAEVLRPRAVLFASFAVQAAMVPALPLFSTDLFTYLAYGELAARNLDPATTGPAALGNSPLVELTTWGTTPSVYGPFSNLIMSIVGHLGYWAGSPLWVAWISYKLISALLLLPALALACGFAEHARRPEAARGFALLALNPLLAWEASAQGHNDALIVVAGIVYVWAVQRTRFTTGVVALMLGTLAKFVLAPSIALHAAALFKTKRRVALEQIAVAGALGVLFYAPRLLAKTSAAKTMGPLNADATHRHVFSLFTFAKGLLKAAHASESLMSVAYVAYVWGGRLLVLALCGLLVYRLRRVTEVAHASFLVLLALIATTAVFPAWYLTWILPFAAAVPNRELQRFSLWTSVLAAPLMGVPWAWLGFPFIQLAGLVFIGAWLRRGAVLHEAM